MIIILFFIAFVILIYVLVSTRQTVVVYQEPEPSWWPWTITSYNWWPYWDGRYGSSGSYSSGTVQHKEPRHTPHQESRPWGGASRHANASAPSSGYGGHGGPNSGGHSGGHGGPSGGHR